MRRIYIDTEPDCRPELTFSIPVDVQLPVRRSPRSLFRSSVALSGPRRDETPFTAVQQPPAPIYSVMSSFS
eukprot:scaffold22013_cov44-Prasinocladus_malaysianus.AAC.1